MLSIRQYQTHDYLPGAVGYGDGQLVGITDRVRVTVTLETVHGETHRLTYRLGFRPTPFNLINKMIIHSKVQTL